MKKILLFTIALMLGSFVVMAQKVQSVKSTFIPKSGTIFNLNSNLALNSGIVAIASSTWVLDAASGSSLEISSDETKDPLRFAARKRRTIRSALSGESVIESVSRLCEQWTNELRQ